MRYDRGSMSSVSGISDQARFGFKRRNMKLLGKQESRCMKVTQTQASEQKQISSYFKREDDTVGGKVSYRKKLTIPISPKSHLKERVVVKEDLNKTLQ